MVVTEVLGSGRTGLLYLAEDRPAGRRAVLRLRLGEGGAPETPGFVEEALGYLPRADGHRHRQGRLPDGTPVEWVEVASAGSLPSAPPARSARPTRPRSPRRLLGVVLVAGSLGSCILGVTPDAEASREAPCVPDARWRDEVAATLRDAELRAPSHPQLAAALRRRRALLASALSARTHRACREVQAALDSLGAEAAPHRR
jgi:hypothetical protein